MKFRDVRSETKKSIEIVCLLLSLGAIFFQIWILATTMESFFQGHKDRLLVGTILSFIAFCLCLLTAWTTGMEPMKGAEEGRTRTYFKDKHF
jgi:hypothetical protein